MLMGASTSAGSALVNLASSWGLGRRKKASSRSETINTNVRVGVIGEGETDEESGAITSPTRGNTSEARELLKKFESPNK